MSQFSPGQYRTATRPVSQPASWALFAFPAFGCALAAIGAGTAFLAAALVGTILLGDSAGPGQPAYDYVTAHFPGNFFGFLTSYPLALAGCCVLVLAATALAVLQKWIPAILLLVVTAVPPWVACLAFISHLWGLVFG
jgi:hypothetical protein